MSPERRLALEGSPCRPTPILPLKMGVGKHEIGTWSIDCCSRQQFLQLCMDCRPIRRQHIGGFDVE